MGKHWVELQLTNSRFTNKIDQLPAMQITVTNGGDKPILFGPDAIHAECNGHPVRIYSTPEYASRILKEAAFDRFVTNSVDAQRINAAQAPGPIPSAQPPVIALQSELFSNAKQIDRVRAKRMSETRFMLYPNEIPPGDTFGGLIYLHAEDIAPSSEILLTVELDRQRHVFKILTES